MWQPAQLLNQRIDPGHILRPIEGRAGRRLHDHFRLGDEVHFGLSGELVVEQGDGPLRLRCR